MTDAASRSAARAVARPMPELPPSAALVQVLPDLAGERFPLYAYYPSRHLPPAKVRAFVDFVVESVAS